MEQSTIHSIYLLLIQSLVALTNEQYCQDCLSTIKFKLNPLYWPNGPLEYGLEKFFWFTSLKGLLFENLLRTIHNPGVEWGLNYGHHGSTKSFVYT